MQKAAITEKLMSPKITDLLHRLFRGVAWITLLVTFMTIGLEAYNASRPAIYKIGHMVVEDITLKERAPFSMLGAFHTLFSSCAVVFFAFLISAIFELIVTKSSRSSGQAERFMTLCCLFYLAEGILNIWTFVPDLFFLKSMTSGGATLLTIASCALDGLLRLTPLLYAISIYALYLHFSRLVSFESEVA